MMILRQLFSIGLVCSAGAFDGRTSFRNHQRLAPLIRRSRLPLDQNSVDQLDGVIPPKALLPPKNESQSSADLQLGFSQLQPFLKIAVPFFQNDEKARNGLIAVLAVTLLNSGVSVVFSYVSRDFYNALNSRDQGMFYEKIELYFAALLVAVPVTVSYRFLREKLSLYWREALTGKVLDDYYSSRTFYQIETLRDIDNPDQRIAEDVRAFTRTSLDFFITVITSIIDLLSFSAILFQIYPPLFLAIIVYSGVGSVVTTNLGRSLVGLNYERLLREADFRFSLIRTRENAEAIAFYDGNASKEKQSVMDLLNRALETQLGIVTTQRNLEVFTTSYRYLVQILPSLIIAPLYFAQKVELGTISQSYGAFNHILGDFSIIINQFEALSAFSAGLTRLSTFLDKIGKGNSTREADEAATTFSMRTVLRDPPSAGAGAGEGGRMVLAVRNLTVLTPDGKRTLIGGIPAQRSSSNSSGSSGSSSATSSSSDGATCVGGIGIDFSLSEGDRVLVVGPSGAVSGRAVSWLTRWLVSFFDRCLV
jgi:putative ATP-binding cassette transporter